MFFENWLRKFNKLRIKKSGIKKSIWDTIKTYDEAEKNLLFCYVQYKLANYTWLLAIATWILAIATIILIFVTK